MFKFSFYFFFNMAPRKFYITYIVCICGLHNVSIGLCWPMCKWSIIIPGSSAVRWREAKDQRTRTASQK